MGGSQSVSVRQVTVHAETGYLKQDPIQRLFSDKAKSGGGPIEGIELRNGNTALITYCSKIDADQVLTRESISFEDNIYRIAKPETLVIQLCNVPTGMNNQTMVLLLEKHHASHLSSCPSVEIDKDKHEALVTFGSFDEAAKISESKAIAYNGISMPIKKVILPADESMLHQCNIVDSSGGELASEESARQVVISGTDKNCNEDMIKLLVENKHRSGGGPIQYIHIDKEKGTVLITFRYKSDADEVLTKWQIAFMDHIYWTAKPSNSTEKTHITKQSKDPSEVDLSSHPDIKIDRYEVLVSFRNVPEKTDPSLATEATTAAAPSRDGRKRNGATGRQLLFTGVEDGSEKDLLHMLLDQGLTADVDIDTANKTALITYHSKADARKAYEYLLNTGTSLTGQSLAVSLLEPLPHDPQSHAVDVTNLDPASTSKVLEMLSLYFGSTKASGGGAIENIYVRGDGKSAVVCFSDHRVAKQVSAKRSHWLKSKRVKVKLFCLRPSPHLFRGPVEPCILLLCWTSPCSVGTHTIQRFIEDASMESSLLHVVFAVEPGKALLVFDREPNYYALRDHCMRYPMLDSIVQVERIPESRSIHVFGFTSVQLLELYFENRRRSGGGDIESLDDCTEYAIISFKRKSMVDRVMKQEHTLNGERLQVRKYFSCLGIPSQHHDGAGIHMPHDIILNVGHPAVLYFISHSYQRREIELKLRDLDCKIALASGENVELTLQCTLNENADDFSIAATEWEDKVKSEVSNIMSKLASTKVTVASTIWAQFQEEFNERMVKADPDMVVMTFCESDCSCTIVGVTKYVDACQNELNETIRILIKANESCK